MHDYDKEAYRAVFSQLHTSVQIDWKEYQTMKKQSRSIRVLGVAAVAAVLVGAMSITAFAFNLFGLKDLAFPQKTTLDVPVVVGTDPDTGEISIVYEEQTVDMISLQGYSGTGEYQASVEWNNYCRALIPTLTLTNDPTGLEERYGAYQVYTREMADKLDEICAKYGLGLHAGDAELFSREELLAVVGENFLKDSGANFTAYGYEDGTFAYDGDTVIDGQIVDYQFRYTKKGILDEVVLNVGNVEDYEQWSYQTSCGVTVTLANSPGKSLILGDLKGGFSAVNVLTSLTPRELEQLADSFDLSALK